MGSPLGRKQRRWPAAAAALLLTVCLQSIAYADPRSGGGNNPAGAIFLVLVGPIVVGICVAAYSLILLVSVLLRREHGLFGFVGDCADRLDGKQLGLVLWGLAELILSLVVTSIFFKLGPMKLVGVLLMFAQIGVMGMGIAGAAAWIERRFAPMELPAETGSAPPIARGLLLLSGASIIPAAGWVVAAITALAGLGAAVERLVSGARRS